MATKKPKSTKTSNKSKSTKPKTAAKTAVKPVSEAPKTKPVDKKVTEITSSTKKSCFAGFFAKKYEGNESIFNVFKTPKFYGALLGELLGTALITLFLFSIQLIGIANVATYAIAITAIYTAVYGFSKACLNPIIAAGMMATRRMSVIRGVMYIIAEVIGAWLGWLIFNSFHLAGGDSAYAVPTMTAIEEGKFWIMASVELLGAIILAFFYARALKSTRSVFTFAVTVAGGLGVAVVIGYVVSAAFLGLNNNFIFNPATALMLKIFPTSGDNFGEIIGGICQALSVYAVLPMIGGVLGFYLSEFTSHLSGEE